MCVWFPFSYELLCATTLQKFDRGLQKFKTRDTRYIRVKQIFRVNGTG